MTRWVQVVLFALGTTLPLAAQAQTLQDLLQADPQAISDPSRRTVGEVLSVLVDSGLPEVPTFLERWRNKEVWQRTDDGLFFYATETDAGFGLSDISTGEPVSVRHRLSLSGRSGGQCCGRQCHRRQQTGSTRPHRARP